MPRLAPRPRQTASRPRVTSREPYRASARAAAWAKTAADGDSHVAWLGHGEHRRPLGRGMVSTDGDTHSSTIQAFPAVTRMCRTSGRSFVVNRNAGWPFQLTSVIVVTPCFRSSRPHGLPMRKRVHGKSLLSTSSCSSVQDVDRRTRSAIHSYATFLPMTSVWLKPRNVSPGSRGSIG